MIHRLTDRIRVVEGGKNGRYPYAHSLYVADGGGILVDAGSDPAEIERLRREDGIAAVVMTHYHEDHFTFLSRLPDTPVWSSPRTHRPSNRSRTLLAWYGVLGNEWEPSTGNCSTKNSPSPRGRSRGGSRTGRGCASAIRARSPLSSRPHARAPVLHFPTTDPVPRRLRPDGVRPVVRRRPCGIDAFRISARRLAAIAADRYVVSHEGPVHRGPIAGWWRSTSPPSTGGRRRFGTMYGSRAPRGDHRAAPDLRPRPGRPLVRLRRVGAPLEAPRRDDRPREAASATAPTS